MPYSKIWYAARDYKYKIPNDLNRSMINIERDEITSFILDTSVDLFKLEKVTFKTVPHMLLLAKDVRIWV